MATAWPLNSLIWPVQKSSGFKRMAVDYHYLIQMATTASAADPNSICTRENKHGSGTWYIIIAFLSTVIARTTRSSLFLPHREDSIPSQSCLRAISPFLLSVIM